jgi:hypothetical protein
MSKETSVEASFPHPHHLSELGTGVAVSFHLSQSHTPKTLEESGLDFPTSLTGYGTESFHQKNKAGKHNLFCLFWRCPLSVFILGSVTYTFLYKYKAASSREKWSFKEFVGNRRQHVMKLK